ncbi:MAG: response regulator [Elusimicrobia bacterium]|nr:response regulator [Elusimicrobiota bacterium]
MAKIIVVDDDTQFYLLLADFLRALGHQVTLATDPSHLYTVVRGFKPDLVILDIQMPEGGGPMAQRVIEEQLGKSVPTLICSGMPVYHQKQWYPELPTRRYVAKPVELGELGRLVAELLPQSISA